jgi:predicted MFS family arabinose efflux permease
VIARIAGRGPAAVLFLSLFAAQAAVIALSPVLVEVAADFEVSTATAGQLRTVSGLAAGLTALAVPRLSQRAGLRTLMLAGVSVIAVGSLASAAAPSFEVLAAAQILIGVAIAGIVAAGTAAAAAWSAPKHQTKVLSWALIGQPAAWIVGMPVIGALGGASWRYGWLALPLVAALLAATLLARRPADAPEPARPAGLRRALSDRQIGSWAAAELLANCGWAGTLVYSGALFTESYRSDATLTGVVLAAGAGAYVAGNLTLRRFVHRGMRHQLVALSLLLAVTIPLFGVVRTSVVVSALLFAAAAFVAGGRTLIGNSFGLEVAPEHRLAAMGLRAAATQFGYFLGSAVAGVALGFGGYPALGLTLGTFFVASALALVELRPGWRRLAPKPA